MFSAALTKRITHHVWTLYCWIPACSALLLGGGHPWIRTSICLLWAMLCWLLIVLPTKGAPNRILLSPFLFVLWLVPLPLRQWHLAPLDDPSLIDSNQWTSLAHDTPGALAWLGYLCVLFLGIAAAQTRLQSHQRTQLLRELAIPCISVATLISGIGLFHKTVGWHTPFLLQTATQPFPTPFVNPNHAAAFFALSASLAVGLALKNKNKDFTWWVLAVILALSCFATGSTAASLAFGLGWLFILARYYLKLTFWAVLPIIVTATWLGPDLTRSLTTLSLAKTYPWPAAIGIGSDYPLGIGPGAFSAVAQRYLSKAEKSYHYVENFILQTWVDFGWFGASLLLFLVTYLVLKAYQQTAPSRRIWWSAIAILMLHNLADFNTVLLCIAAPALGVVTIISSQRIRTRPNTQDLKYRWTRSIIPTAVLCLSSGLLASVFNAIPIELDRLRQNAPNYPTIQQRHRSEASLALQRAQQHQIAQPTVALKLYSHALRLAPSRADIHRALGSFFLEHQKTSQAAYEFGQACALSQPKAASIAKGIRAYDQQKAKVATDQSVSAPNSIDTNVLSSSPSLGQRYVEVWLHRPKTPSAVECLRHALLRTKPIPSQRTTLMALQYLPSLEFQLSLIRYMLRDPESSAQLFAANKAAILLKKYPNSLETFLVAAQVFEKQNQLHRALAVLNDAPVTESERPRIYERRAHLLLKLGEKEPLLAFLEQWERLAVAAQERARVIYIRGRWSEQQNRLQQALEYYLEAQSHSYRSDAATAIERLEKVLQ